MGSKSLFHNNLMALHDKVSGSCIFNTFKFPNAESKNILVDCGLFHEEQYISLNNSLTFKPENLNAVVVTHAHGDHIGRLPLLFKKGYRGKIYASTDTASIMKIALYDSSKVLRNRAKLLNEPPLYDDDDVEQTLALVKAIPFEECVQIANNINLTFFMNGHLPGSSMLLFQVSYHSCDWHHFDDINLLFTGDYASNNVFFDVSSLPNWVYKLPISIIQEATYGYMETSEIQHVFEENMLEAISLGKQVLVPVLSLGRSQEILFLLKKWQQEGKLDVNVPIYYDGKLGMHYNNLYLSGTLNIKEECRNFLPTNFSNVVNPEMRDDLIRSDNCKIILTTSGMGSHGPAQVYLPAFLKKANALIHFTSYLAEGTLGRELIESKKGEIVKAAGLTVKVLAEVKTTSEFSKHAKRDELLAFLENFQNIKAVLINHGEASSKETYASAIVNRNIAKDVGILGRDYLFRLDSYGVLKTLSTKFGY